MRLAFGMHRSHRDLLEDFGADELTRWEVFEALYDFPDGYHASGTLGPLVNQSLGGHATRETFVPYHKPPPRPKSPGACAATLRAFANAAKILGKKRV